MGQKDFSQQILYNRQSLYTKSKKTKILNYQIFNLTILIFVIIYSYGHIISNCYLYIVYNSGVALRGRELHLITPLPKSFSNCLRFTIILKHRYNVISYAMIKQFSQFQQTT
jgi:hypothetical protein